MAQGLFSYSDHAARLNQAEGGNDKPVHLADMAQISELFVKRTTRYEPRPEAHQFYRQYADFYGRLLFQNEPAYTDLATLPEWPR